MDKHHHTPSPCTQFSSSLRMTFVFHGLAYRPRTSCHNRQCLSTRKCLSHLRRMLLAPWDWMLVLVLVQELACLLAWVLVRAMVWELERVLTLAWVLAWVLEWV